MNPDPQRRGDRWTALACVLGGCSCLALLAIVWWSALADRTATPPPAPAVEVPGDRGAAILAPRVAPPPTPLLDAFRGTPAPLPSPSLAGDAPPDTVVPLDPGTEDPLADLGALRDPDRAPISRPLWESATATAVDAIRLHGSTATADAGLSGVDPSRAGCCTAIAIDAVTAHVDPADHRVVQVVVVWSDGTPGRAPQVLEQVDVLRLHATRRSDGHAVWTPLPETFTDDS